MNHVVTAHTENVQETITGFQHEIVAVSRATASHDLAFVLPQYVVAGCEARIVHHCRVHGVVPPVVGVSLPVSMSASLASPVQVVTVASHQLRTMKQFYFARDHVATAARALAWVQALAPFRDDLMLLPAPLYDCMYYDKVRCRGCLCSCVCECVRVHASMSVGA